MIRMQNNVDQYTEFLDNKDGCVRMRHVQNVDPVLKLAKAYRNAESLVGFTKPKNFNLFATIPNELIVKLRAEHGVDIFRVNKDPAMAKKFRRLMQYEYKDFKCTNRTHL